MTKPIMDEEDLIAQAKKDAALETMADLIAGIQEYVDSGKGFTAAGLLLIIDEKRKEVIKEAKS